MSTRSLKPDYNLDRLIRAVLVLYDAGVPIRLTLAGDGPQREDLVALTRQLHLEHAVDFVGFVPNDELPKLLARHDIYVSLVKSDGVSASLLEAMAVGLLPIVPDNPANRVWIKTGHNGILLNDLSPAAIAGALSNANSDNCIRRRAWQENAEVVRRDADLYRNAEVFVERFRRLANEYRSR